MPTRAAAVAVGTEQAGHAQASGPAAADVRGGSSFLEVHPKLKENSCR